MHCHMEVDELGIPRQGGPIPDLRSEASCSKCLCRWFNSYYIFNHLLNMILYFPLFLFLCDMDWYWTYFYLFFLSFGEYAIVVTFGGNLMVIFWKTPRHRNWGIAHEATAAKKKEAPRSWDHELTEESPCDRKLGWWERTIPYPILIYSWSSWI